MATFNQPDQSVTHQNKVSGDMLQENHDYSVTNHGNIGSLVAGRHNQVNIGTQHISNLNNLADSDKQQLQQCIEQFNAELAKLPDQQQAQEMAELLEALIQQAAAEQPNNSVIKVTAQGLQEAANAIATIAPTIVDIVKQILQYLR